MKLCRKQCLYILRVLRDIADPSKNLDFSSWAQLIKMFGEEGKKPLLSSCFEATLHYVQRQWPMIDELSSSGFAPTALPELDIVLYSSIYNIPHVLQHTG